MKLFAIAFIPFIFACENNNDRNRTTTNPTDSNSSNLYRQNTGETTSPTTTDAADEYDEEGNVVRRRGQTTDSQGRAPASTQDSRDSREQNNQVSPQNSRQ